ncbi:hypothetical protein YC2023_017047 [Brassica napus]
MCHSLQLHLQPPYLHCVLLDPLTEAERAPGRDIHTGQAPSSATDTGGLSGKAKEVDDANLPSEKKKNQKLTP